MSNSWWNPLKCLWNPVRSLEYLVKSFQDPWKSCKSSGIPRDVQRNATEHHLQLQGISNKTFGCLCKLWGRLWNSCGYPCEFNAQACDTRLNPEEIHRSLKFVGTRWLCTWNSGSPELPASPQGLISGSPGLPAGPQCPIFFLATPIFKVINYFSKLN